MKQMKKMKLIGLMTMATIFSVNISWAQSNDAGAAVQPLQEYKLNMTSGRLIVKEVNEVEFVGHSGSGVIIQAAAANKNDSERAEGLKLINGLGLEDNTNVGLNVEKEGDSNVIRELSSRNSRAYIIQVPKGVTIVYEHSSSYGDDVVFKNILGEIESTTNHNDVVLENVTGPITVNTVHGDIDGGFTTINQANPISIVSSHGDIDLSIPESTKANLKIDTSWGEIYSDLNIAIKPEEGKMKSYGGNNVAGTLNGGGVSFQIKSTHGNIYLRKK
jgi:hypothetical protein